MRLVTIALLLLIAAPALAAPAGGLRVINARPEGAGLRGAQAAPNLTAPGLSGAAPAPLPPPIQSKAPLGFFAAAAQPPAANPGACRRLCARDYYFCLAGEDSSGCPESWTSCRNDCSRNSRPLP